MPLSLTWLSLLLNAVLIWFSLSTFSSYRQPRPHNFQNIDAEQWYEKHPVDLLNASAVFNTVHGALKEKDNSIFPVGVSFIPAYIPPNTLMYHSTGLPHVPESYEWIAMDYEFSYSFAGFDRGNGPPRFGKPHKRPHKSMVGERSQEVITEEFVHPFRGTFLYTFRNTKPLDKLIYLDGASAAKTNTGEMDQQLILSRQKDINKKVNEYEAAEKICKWGKEFGLQGFIRLEVGFEMVLCDFHDGIELVANVTLNNITSLAHLPYEKRTPKTPLEEKRKHLVDKWSYMNRFEHQQAGAGVDSGDQRILLDFSKMVTPLNHTWLNPDPYKRRIHNLSEELKEALISDVRQSVLEPVDPFHQTNWQVLTRRIEEKFAPMLSELNTTLGVFEASSKEGDLGAALETAISDLSRLTFNFVRRYSDDNTEDEETKEKDAIKMAIKDYAYHTFPLTTRSDSLIYSSLYRVTREVVETVFEIFRDVREMMLDIYIEPKNDRHDEFKHNLLTMKQKLADLLGALRWSIFTRCSRLCKWDEVCYTPTWGPGPMGWGANDKYFEFDGERYRIPMALQCVNYKDMRRW